MTVDNLFFFNDTATTEIYTLSLHDALPISEPALLLALVLGLARAAEREDVVLHLDRDVVLGQAGEIRLQNEVVVRLHEIHRGHPALDAAAAPSAVEKGAEEPIELLAERLWPHQKGHASPPRCCYAANIKPKS